MNVDQSKPDPHFDSQIDPYILCILIEYIYGRRQHQMLRREHSTRSLGDTYQVQISGAHTKLASKCPGGGRGGRVG